MENTSETPVSKSEIPLPDTLVVPVKYCALMYNMIHVIAKRGGIGADEFTVVGELTDFLKKELRVDEHLAKQKEEASGASDNVATQ